MILERNHFSLNNKSVIERLVIKTPFKYPAVFENEACFIFVKEGESILQSPTEHIHIQVSESVLLKCGSYFARLLPQREGQNCEIFAVHLHTDVLKELYKNEVPHFLQSTTKKHFANKIEKQDIIIHFIKSLEFYFQNPSIVHDDLLKLKIKELILLLLQTNSAEDLKSLFSHLFTPRQANFKEVIQNHLYNNLSTKELAVLSGRSLSAFKRDFESYFKDSPAHYIKEQKLIKAAMLLCTSEASISEICYQIGFNDISHFSKLFKSKYGHTPSQYKNTFNKT